VSVVRGLHIFIVERGMSIIVDFRVHFLRIVLLVGKVYTVFLYVYCFNFYMCRLEKNTVLWIVSGLPLYYRLRPRLGFRQSCVASFLGIRWHVAHNRRNMAANSEIQLRWCLLTILQSFRVCVCASCGGTARTLINFNQFSHF
jgi:hypothetical protein